MKKIIVAIDGYSSCGKSTIAKGLAEKLGYIFIDTGAMYRATTLYFLDNDVDFKDKMAVENALNNISIRFEKENGRVITFLNNKNVEKEIRTMRVSQSVSPVATISAVRRAMVREQQAMGKAKSIVLDGRDIGTVVFPDAELKLFITANPDIRAQRRVDELRNKGEKIDFEMVKANLLERDHIDSNRADSPLRQAEDSIVIDTTDLKPNEQLEMACQLALEKIN
jgi:cytidylate kinase